LVGMDGTGLMTQGPSHHPREGAEWARGQPAAAPDIRHLLWARVCELSSAGPWPGRAAIWQDCSSGRGRAGSLRGGAGVGPGLCAARGLSPRLPLAEPTQSRP